MRRAWRALGNCAAGGVGYHCAMGRHLRWWVTLLMLLAGSSTLSAQYFGQNKVRHKVLLFEVMHTQNFDS